MTPYARSKQVLEQAGYFVGRTEHWNSFIHRRQDLYNLFDLVAVKSDEKGVLGVNPTTGSNIASHITKWLEGPILRVWLESGNRAELHGWRKVGERGKRKTWSCRIVHFEMQRGMVVPVYPAQDREAA